MRRKGFLVADASEPPADEEAAGPLAAFTQLALLPGLRLSEAVALELAPDEPPPPPSNSASASATFEGVNVHAGVTVSAGDFEALGRLVRYLLRPSFSLARLSLNDEGAVIYRLRKPDKKGRTCLALSPLEFLARLAALLPAPRFALRREIGLFSPGCKLRHLVVPEPRGPPPPRCNARGLDGATHTDAASFIRPVTQLAPSAGLLPPSAPQVAALPALAQWPAASTPASPTRTPWAELLHRSFDLDALRCSNCGGRLQKASVVRDLAEAERLLRQRGCFWPLHPSARPRGPSPPRLAQV